MTLHRRIMQLERRAPARNLSGAAERLMTFLDRIAARLPNAGPSRQATATDLQAELAVILQRPRP
jgi:hypothetical protein